MRYRCVLQHLLGQFQNQRFWSTPTFQTKSWFLCTMAKPLSGCSSRVCPSSLTCTPVSHPPPAAGSTHPAPPSGSLLRWFPLLRMFSPPSSHALALNHPLRVGGLWGTLLAFGIKLHGICRDLTQQTEMEPLWNLLWGDMPGQFATQAAIDCPSPRNQQFCTESRFGEVMF